VANTFIVAYVANQLTDSVEMSTYREADMSLSYSRNSQYFMEIEGSLPCSQELSTGPYPEPDESSPRNLLQA
jgi:hypothetical protein